MNLNDIFLWGLSFNDAIDRLGPVAVYVLGMAVYAIFVFKFYRFVAARDMFEFNLSRYENSRFRPVRVFLHLVMYVGKYIVLFPVFALFWFAGLTVILAFLSQDRSFSNTLLMALATVSAIRVTAYLSQDLSRDLAKLLPFAVLATFLIDASFFTIADSLDALWEVENYIDDIIYYVAFLIALEFALRIIMGFAKLLFPGDKAQTPEEPGPVEETQSPDEADGPTSAEGQPQDGRGSTSGVDARSQGG